MHHDVQAHALQTAMSDKSRLGKLEASRCALLLCDVQVRPAQRVVACIADLVVMPCSISQPAADHISSIVAQLNSTKQQPGFCLSHRSALGRTYRACPPSLMPRGDWCVDRILDAVKLQTFASSVDGSASVYRQDIHCAIYSVAHCLGHVHAGSWRRGTQHPDPCHRCSSCLRMY